MRVSRATSLLSLDLSLMGVIGLCNRQSEGFRNDIYGLRRLIVSAPLQAVVAVVVGSVDKENQPLESRKK